MNPERAEVAARTLPMKLAVFQCRSAEADTEAAFDTISRVLHACSVLAVDHVVFPELFLPCYNDAEAIKRQAQPLDGPWMRRLSDLARTRRCGVSVGWAEASGGAIFNSATAFDPNGRILGHHRKLQLFGDTEKAIFSPGDGYTVFDLGPVKAALLICYDVEFAEHVAALAKMGVRVVLVPTANPAAFPNVPGVLVKARALEAGLWVAYANYCGSEGGLLYSGGSLVAGPDGDALASAGDGEALLVAGFDAADRGQSTQRADFRGISRK